MNKRKAKGIGLLSGGLDSMLAVKVLQQQELELIGITFVTPFFGPEGALEAGSKTGIEVRVMDISDEHLQMVRNPRYGYGSQMNPCIDCHGLMFRIGGRVMEREGADFLFSGEVLGQRPMSQRRDSLRSVEKLSGCEGRILRPLSARLLAPTVVEQQGLVDREMLLDIHGRGRKRQMELARRFGLHDYPQPGGGCVLTKEGFARRLRFLLDAFADVAPRDIEFLKWGRMYRLPHGSICIIGRNRADNQRLLAHTENGDVMLQVPDFPAPRAVMPAVTRPGAKDIRLAALILVSYCDAQAGNSVRVIWRHRGQTGTLVVLKLNRRRFLPYSL